MANPRIHGEKVLLFLLFRYVYIILRSCTTNKWFYTIKTLMIICQQLFVCLFFAVQCNHRQFCTWKILPIYGTTCIHVLALLVIKTTEFHLYKCVGASRNSLTEEGVSGDIGVRKQGILVAYLPPLVNAIKDVHYRHSVSLHQLMCVSPNPM